MPVHAHDGTERLKPEWMRQPAQQLVAAVVVNDGLADDRSESRHSRAQPGRDMAPVKCKISASRTARHYESFDSRKLLNVTE
jgi:hypothetical protein